MSLTPEQIEERKQGIGGSDVAPALGVSPWKSPLALYMEKTGELEPDDLSDNEAVYFGSALEEFVGKEFARRTGKKIRRINQALIHPELDFLRANIDRRVLNEPAGLEIKTASAFTADKWGPEGSEEIPPHYLLQVAHYMAVTDLPMWYVCVLIGGNDLRVYSITRDQDIENAMLRRLEEFWQRVKDRNPPPVSQLADVNLLYPKDAGRIKVADDATLAQVRELSRIQMEIKDLMAIKKQREFELKAMIGDASVVVDDDKKAIVTWRSHERVSINTARLKKERPEIADEYAVTSTVRPMRINV